MTNTTSNSMNLLAEKPEIMISAKISNRLKLLIYDAAAKMNLSVSQYIKLALIEKINNQNIKDN